MRTLKTKYEKVFRNDKVSNAAAATRTTISKAVIMETKIITVKALTIHQ